MNENERRVISSLEKLEKNKGNEYIKDQFLFYFERLKELPFNQITAEFLGHPLLIKFLSDQEDEDSIQFWYLVASYFMQQDIHGSQQEQLLKIDQFCSAKIHSFNRQNFTLWPTEDLKKSGCHLQSDFLNNPFVIKNIYASMDEQLISVIKKYAAVPRPHVFAGAPIPDMIAKEQEAVCQTITSLLKRKEHDIESVEAQAIKLQRRFRLKQRFQEEHHRVTHVYQDFFTKTSERSKRHVTAEKLLHEANHAYIPRECNRALAARIIGISQKIKLYTTIRHITSSEAIRSIFNDALYGRRTLQQFFIPFKPAALMGCDIENGDGNVICFAPNKIDPNATGDIEIVLDLKSVIDEHPAAFFKEFDLEYFDDEIREVKLNDKLFLFLPLVPLPVESSADDPIEMIPFKVLGPTWGELLYYSQIPKNTIIAYDLKNMSEILILNFFRFIDELKCPNGEPATDYIAEFYKALEAMPDKELEEFLKASASKLTQTAEFNFYGAYRLNFSAIITIRLVDRVSPGNLKQEYTLNMKLLKDSLDSGDLSILEHAKKFMPSLFTSYRFMDYLISNTTHAGSREALESLRMTCDVPPWIDNQYYQQLNQTKQNEGCASKFTQ